MKGKIINSIIKEWNGMEVKILHVDETQKSFWVSFIDPENGDQVDGWLSMKTMHILETNNRDMIPTLMRW